MKMGETNKQVRVDNWGIFFLQRLQLFFNKTDYCDLTLQFEGNVQLKVHRLVMSACTDYFNMLEQTCEVIDGNILVMPHDLQSDVILPIVNFMYTGMLEFHTAIFDKLYNTAELMNIPVLTKLLDAQKKPIAPLPKPLGKKPQTIWNLQGKKVSPKVENDLPPTLPGRKLPVWKRKSAPQQHNVVSQQHNMVPHNYYSEVKRTPPDPLATYDNTPKPTRFEWPEDEINSTFNLMDNSFDDISYSSKPLFTQDDELRAGTSFDDIRHLPSTHKKVKDVDNQCIDMDEVKDYVKEQRIRSDLVDYEDEDDPDRYLETYSSPKEGKRRLEKAPTPVSKRVRFSINEKENKETKVNLKHSGKTTDMNHTKIISEVLKKYPHLVKKNKNIRLKILAKSPNKPETQKPLALKTTTSKLRVQVSSPKVSRPKQRKLLDSDTLKDQDDGPWVCVLCSTVDEPVEFVLYYLYRKHMTDMHNEKFDSRMCKFCGHQSSKHNMLMYHQYTRHGIKPPAAYNFPKCNRCPYIALTENLLIKHKLNHTKFDLQCIECRVAFNNEKSLASHTQITGHNGKTGRNNYDCQYCTKRYQSGSNLFSHIKLLHREEARRDGIVSIDETEELEEEQVEEENEGEEYIGSEMEDSKEKIKILSNIKVPTPGENVSQCLQPTSLDPGADNEALGNVPGGIATSLGLVDIVVLDDNQQYILHDDQQLVTQQALSNHQPEYILPEISDQHGFEQTQGINEVMTSEHNVITQSMLGNSDIASTDELVMVLTDHDYNDGNNLSDNSNIVVLYSHPVDGQQSQFITSQGNLMLNSQTGILEIRNNASTSTDAANSQVESIEMIQREVNNHTVMTSQKEDVKPELVHVISTSSPTMTANVEPLTQNTVILDSQLSNDGQLNGDSVDALNRDVEGKDVELESTPEDVVEQAVVEEADNEVVCEDVSNLQKNVEEQPMEIDEDCSIIETTDQVEKEEMESDKCVQETEVVIDITEDQNDVREAAEENVAVEEEEKTENANAETPEVAALDEPVQTDPEVPEEVAETVREEQVTKEPEEEHEPVITHVISVERISEVPVGCQEHVVVVDGNSDDKPDTTAEHRPEPEPQEAQSEGQTDDLPENLIVDTPSDLPQAEPENLSVPSQSEQCDDAVPCDGEPPVTETVPCEPATAEAESSPENTENEPAQAPGEPVADESSGQADGEVLVVREEAQAETVEGGAENEKSEGTQMQTDVPESLEPQDDDTCATPQSQIDACATPQSQIDACATPPSQMDACEAENDMCQINLREDVASGAAKCVLDVEGMQGETAMEEESLEVEKTPESVDENSQSQESEMSQSSQDSSKQVPLIVPDSKKKSSQVTKISILDDWEDTDSQQSDNIEKKTQTTVHNLIVDWDDDDDDGTMPDT